MNRSNRSNPRTPLIVVAVAITLLLSGCKGTGPVGPAPAARIGDRTITMAEVIDKVEADRAEQAAETGMAAVETPNTVAMDDAITALYSLIERDALADAVDRLGGEVTDADRAAATQMLTMEDGEVWGGDLNLEKYSLLQALDRLLEPDEAALAAAHEEMKFRYQQICFSGVVVATEAEATEVEEALDGGATFEQVFERNIDPQLEADQGQGNCLAAADLEAQIGWDPANVPAGTVLLTTPYEMVVEADTEGDGTEGDGPEGDGTEAEVPETESVFLVVVSTSVHTPELDDIREDLIEADRADREQRKYQAFLASMSRVELNPRFGSWDPEAFPTGPFDPLAVPSTTQLDGFAAPTN